MRTGVKKLLSVFLSVVLCLSLLCSSIPAFAFRVNSTIGMNLTGANWMSGIKDDTLISDISMPGTHDSGARIVDQVTTTWAKCQNLTISAQLSAGVRYLDMRLEYDTGVSGSVRVVHSTINCYNDAGGALDFDSVINDCYKFLDQNPTETIIMSVKEDDGSNTSTLANVIMDKIYAKSSYWYMGSSTPQLKDVRKKIVLAKRISQIYGGLNLSWGDQGSDGGSVEINSSLEVQDRYNMGTSNKWLNAARPMLEKDKPSGKFFLNFMSTTGAGISGVSACAGEMNGKFFQYELRNNKCYGIIIFDYIDENLAKKVYQCNDLASKNQADPMSGQYYYRINMYTSNNVDSGWSRVSLKLYYRTNNGTGSEYCYTVFENDSGETKGYQYVCSVGNWDFTGIINGFPTRLEFSYSFSGSDKHLVTEHYLYVGTSASGDLTLLAENHFNAWGSYSGTESYNTDSSAYPQPSSINFDYPNRITYTAPKEGEEVYTSEFGATIFDQYGVKWYEGPTSYSMKTSIPGVQMVGNTVIITYLANKNKTQKGTYIRAYYEKGDYYLSNVDEKYMVVVPNKLDYSYLGYDGSVLYKSEGYYDTDPVYVGETPVKPYDEAYHYVFSEWSPKTTIQLTNNNYTAQFTSEKHTYVDDGIAPEGDQPAKLRHQCSYCGYYYDTDYDVDSGTLTAALERAKQYEERDYSSESYQLFKELYDEYSALAEDYPSQAEVDNAVRNILNAASDLVPYLTLRVGADNGSCTVSYNGETYTNPIYSVLFGTEVTLTATAKDGYRFDGWYENDTKRVFSHDETYTFVVTSNTSFTAKYVKENSSVLTFANETGQITSAIEKTLEEWKNVTTIADMLPQVPYKVGYGEGRWAYDEADVLSKLQSGISVTILPQYDEIGFTYPTVPEPVDGKPALNLYYQLDADKNIGSFTMALGVPEGCRVESVGIGFYFADADKFNPTEFDLNINNKLLTGKFNFEDSDGIYIVNMNKFTADYNWAARGYVTYYDDNGVLKVAYTNQINVIDLNQVS